MTTTLRHQPSPTAIQTGCWPVPRLAFEPAVAGLLQLQMVSAVCRDLRARGEFATDGGDVQSAGADGDLRGTVAKHPQVTSSPRSANSEGAELGAHKLSGRGLSHATQPRGTP